MRVALTLLFASLVAGPSASALETTPTIAVSSAIASAAARGNVIRGITDISEFESMFGQPANQTERPDGGGSLFVLTYPDGTRAEFKQFAEEREATLLSLDVGGRPIELDRTALRTASDLQRLNHFTGASGASLDRLDLRGQHERLAKLAFDTKTEWPTSDKLPPGFSPQAILDDGKNPGLGLRALHRKKIDGRGVGLAIIDQPLLLSHQEYASRLVYYSAVSAPDAPPQMHGSAVASFAVGREVGAAPMASLYYFAVPTWVPDNNPLEHALREIIRLNRAETRASKIRVVSVSIGDFRQRRGYAGWKAAVRDAEAAGILVLTCDPEDMDFGNLALSPGANPNIPGSYAAEEWDQAKHRLWVPGGRRTRASDKGVGDFTFDPVGGRSWVAPYVAGVAALAFQVNPKLTPSAMKELLYRSASPANVGPVIDPARLTELANVNTAR